MELNTTIKGETISNNQSQSQTCKVNFSYLIILACICVTYITQQSNVCACKCLNQLDQILNRRVTTDITMHSWRQKHASARCVKRQLFTDMSAITT